MADKKLTIRHFRGKNIKADPADMDHHSAQTVDGFDISSKPGALVKRLGYTDQASVILPASYPTGWTIKNFFQFRVTKPTVQNVFVVHATVSGEDRIYVDYTYNGSAWVQGWVELTEMEEGLTADASTNTTTIVDSALSSSTNDYYNGWYVFNWTRGVGSLVSDYVGGTKTITLLTAIASQASGDSYSIYRFPLVVQYEGTFTTDTGSSTTQVYDIDNPNTDFYELPQDFDDAYNTWVINNATAGDTQTITDYEAFFNNNVQYLTHAALASQTDGDSFTLYKTTRSLSVDDKVHFRQRPNVCVMATGNAARYPKQYPMWYGFIRKTYYFGQNGNNVSAGYYLEPATLQAPDDSIYSCDTQAGTLDLNNSTMYVACAYVYDGYQVGPLTSIKRAYDQRHTLSANDVDVRVTFSIGYSAAPNMAHSKTLSKRVTHVNVYGSTDLDTGAKSATWFMLTSIPIREDFAISSFPGSRQNIGRQGFEREPFSNRRNWGRRSIITSSGRTTVNRPQSTSVRSWSGSDPYARTFDITSTVWSNKSEFYTLTSGGMGGDRVNYSFGDDTIYHSAVGKLFVDDPEPSLIAFSPLKTDGTPSPDYYPLLNMLDLANYGITRIFDLKIIGDYVYCFGDSKAMRFLMNSDLVPTFKPDIEYEHLGTEAPYGIAVSRNRIFGVFKRGIYMLDSQERYVSRALEDTSSYPLGVTDLTEAFTVYSPLTSQYYVSFPTDTNLFVYDMATGEWMVHNTGAGLVAMVVGDDGEVYGASTGKIFKLDNGTTDDSTAIAPTWKSKVYNMGAPDIEKVLVWAEVTYKSNTVVDFDVYIDRSASTASWNVATDNQLAAATTVTTKRLLFPHTFRGFEFEFEVTIPSGSQATNTSLEIHEINVLYNIEERIT